MSWRTPTIAASTIVAAFLLAPETGGLSIPVLLLGTLATGASGVEDISSSVKSVAQSSPDLQPLADDISKTIQVTAVSTVLIVAIVAYSHYRRK